MELIDLTIQDISRLAIQRSGPDIILSWPTYGRSGIGLEAASGLDGPWSALLSQPASDITNIMVTVPVSQAAQFYRLRR